MNNESEPTEPSTRNALALWCAQGCATATDAEVQAFIDDANAYAREENARDWRTEPMITRATAELPPALVGIRLIDAETGQGVGSQFRTDPRHMQPRARDVLSLLVSRNGFSRILGEKVSVWREAPLDRFERRRSEFPGILDITVFGGVAHPLREPAPLEQAA